MYSSMQTMQMIANERAADWRREASHARLAREITQAVRRTERAARQQLAAGSARNTGRPRRRAAPAVPARAGAAPAVPAPVTGPAMTVAPCATC